MFINTPVQVHGDHGNSKPIPLGDCPENFEQGEQDVFSISLPDLGTITAITINHDGTGPYPEWHLDKIEISNKHSRELYLFQYSQWLGKAGGGESVSIRVKAVRQFVNCGVSEEEVGKPGVCELDSSITNEV